MNVFTLFALWLSTSNGKTSAESKSRGTMVRRSTDACRNVRHQVLSACAFINPYGDTTFNEAQVAVLEQELAAIDAPDEIAGQARSLLAFVREVQDRMHRYLKFIGD